MAHHGLYSYEAASHKKEKIKIRALNSIFDKSFGDGKFGTKILPCTIGSPINDDSKRKRRRRT